MSNYHDLSEIYILIKKFLTLLTFKSMNWIRPQYQSS